METIDLRNKPLAEAIFELRWKLELKAPDSEIDPYYRLRLGRVYDKLKNEYKHYEPLPSSTVPDEMVARIPQYRFRKMVDGWPLVQMGPGVITLNDTQTYIWPDFRNRIDILTKILYETKFEDERLIPNSILLRYIDSEPLQFENENVLKFLREKMKITIDLENRLFNNVPVSEKPVNIDLRLSFPTTSPKGIIGIRFFKGTKEKVDVLFWETMVQSNEANVPQTQNEIMTWIDQAHEVTHDWFMKMIEGELLEKYK